ncbi:MAG: type II toxin-antitoxin system HicB family antitoxin [Planctomycetes bacterium]|nr:type II toxin-antitoxin system HicB family antitoxin [Planctomycetota bacterium]
MKEHKDYTVIVEQSADGTYTASVPELAGCCAQGKTIEEVRARIKEQILKHMGVEPGGGSVRLE